LAAHYLIDANGQIASSLRRGRVSGNGAGDTALLKEAHNGELAKAK